MASGGVGSCNGVSVGRVCNNGSPSSSASVGDGGRTADPMGVAKTGRFLLVFPLGVGRMRT